MEMKKYKLGDLGKIVTGKTPRTSIEENYGGDIPFITPSDDLSVKDIREVSKKITELGLKEVKNCLLPPRSICVSCIGSDMGKVVMTSVPSVTNQQFNSIIPNESFDADYIYYLMIPIGQQMKNKLGKQSTAVPIVSKSQFSDIDVSIISDIKDQKKVSSVLSSIDNRIENLRAQNRVLEQTAKTIYDYTFLQCAGHQTTYNKTLNRNIPADWEVKKLGEIADFKNGINYDPSKPGDKKTKIVNVRNVSSSTYFISETDLDDLFVDEKHAAKYYVSQDDILITRSGTPGAARMIAPSKEPVVYCGFIIKMTFDDKKMKNYLFFKMKELEFAIQKQSAGSILSNISQDILNNLEIAIPDANTLNDFNAQIEPLLKKQQVNTKQIETLTTQRNTLLPLLMTGQIEV